MTLGHARLGGQDGGRGAGPDGPETFPVIVERVSRIHTAVNWFFWAFVFSIPMEEITTSMGFPISFSKLLGYVFMGGTLIQPRVCFRRPPAAFWWFFAYLCVTVLLAGLQPDADEEDVFRQVAVAVQMTVLLWLGCNLLRYEQTVKGALIAFVLSCLVVAVLQRAGLGEAVEVSNRGREARITTFGQNPNVQGYILGLGFLILAQFVYVRDRSLIRPRFLSWPLFLLLLAAVIQTGSRGSTLALGLGLAGFFLGAGGGSRTFVRLRNAGILVGLLGLLVALSLFSETARLRWQRTFESGNTAGRLLLFRLAGDMIEEKPLFGWGPVGNRQELYFRSGEISEGDFQNTFLHVVAEAGFIGSLPFFVGVYLWLRAAWEGRRGVHGVLPLAMTVTTVAVCMSTTYVYRKEFWLVIALTLVSGRHLIRARTWHLAEAVREGVGPRDEDEGPGEEGDAPPTPAWKSVPGQEVRKP
jgi:O-antigen ligase